MLNNITIKIPDEILPTITSPQGDNVVSKILCFFYVWGFFLFLVFQICISKWKIGMNANWKIRVGSIEHSAFIFTFSGSTLQFDLCPRTLSLCFSCPLASYWFQPIGGSTRRKEDKIIRYSFLPHLNSLPHNPSFWLWLFPYVCPLLLGRLSPKPHLSLAMVGSLSIITPSGYWSSRGFPLWWVPECLTIPFCFS